MKTILLLCAAIVVAARLNASLSSASGSLIVIATPQPRSVAASISMPAQFVSVPLTIISDQKNAAAAYEETAQAVEAITRKAKENGNIQLTRGVATLTHHKSSIGISSGSWSQPAASAQVYVLVPLAKPSDNVFVGATEAARFVGSLQLPGKTRCEIGKVQLAIDNPEQYRNRLLELIRTHIDESRKTLRLSAGAVNVDGLESPVLVRQADDRMVELFLNYSISIGTERP